MSAILTVLAKEVRENLRQRRTVLGALLYGPLIGPVLFALMLSLMIAMQTQGAHQPLKLPVAGAAHAPHLIAALKADGLAPTPVIANPRQLIAADKTKVVLRIPPDYAKLASSGRTTEVELFYNSSQRDVRGTVARVKALLKNWSQQHVAMRLMARGIAPSVATPLVIAERDQATPRSRAGRFLSFLPYFFVIALFYGGMYLANDLTAGERERQSLEPLFANPVARWRILTGKLAAVSAFSVASLIISLIGVIIVVRLVPTSSLDVSLDLGAKFFGLGLLLYLPLGTLVAVAQTLVAAFAKSYREAQSYLQVMMIVLIIPSLIMSLIPIHAQWWMYLVPVLGQQLGVSELLGGSMPSAAHVVLCLAGSIAATLLLGALTAWVYRSERLAISA